MSYPYAGETPMGGDELNVVRAGRNYGMPVISYGRQNSGALINGGKTAQATALKGMPIWAFHGDADSVVKFATGQAIVDAAKAAGADIKFTVYPGVGHNSWGKAYAEPELEAWILARKK